MTTEVVDLLFFNGNRATSRSLSSWVRLGGSGGSVVGSYTGARTRPLSVVRVEVLEAVVTVESVESVDSFEPRRVISVGRRAGNAGAAF
jgi:hypothetical protein